MGGHRAGEVASKLAVETFTKSFNHSLKSRNSKISNNKKEDVLTSNEMKNFLISSIKIANKEVFSKSISQLEYYGMGTTFTGCYISDRKAYIIHVGDSRLYIKRNSSFKPLTFDHTIVGELYRRGKISYQETFNHPKRNYLTNVIGVAEDVKPDFLSYELLSDDILLLCSDGLNSMLKDDQICRIIEKYKDTADITKNLIKSALKKGGFDNITIIVIKV